MPGQGRLGDKANVPLDAHGCPACPHPAVGPAIGGSPNVRVNMLPALRVDDPGVHAACCGSNMWIATTGSATVFINGKAAHRMGDQNRHCGGMGRLIEGSPNVIVGDSGGGGGGGLSGGGRRGTGGGGGGVGSGRDDGGRGARKGGVDGGDGRATGNDRPADGTDDGDDAKSWFEVVVVDDLGAPMGGVELVFDTAGGSYPLATDGAGIARLDDVPGGHAAVRFASVQAVRDAVFPRWEGARQGERPAGEDVVEVPVRDPIAALAIAERRPAILVLVPHVVRVRLTGMYFDNAKSFLLPDAMRGMTKLRDLEAELPEARFLVVGHTNTVGGPGYNDALSLERATSVASFLHDRVDDWYAWYGSDTSWEKRWGAPEDRYMLGALPQDASDKYLQGDLYTSYRRFQEANGLPISGTGDEATRKALITEYMAQDRTSLPASAEVTAHGCGEHFTEVEPGEHEHNRRVEIFVFDGPITPPPQGELSGPGATDYPAWRALTLRTFDFSTGTTTVMTGSVWIRLELAAADADASSDKLVLRATDGYRQEHMIANDHVAADDAGEAIDIEFTEAPIDGVFTLTIVSSDGESYEVFADVPFAALGALGLAPDAVGDTTDDALIAAAITGIDQPPDGEA